MVSALRRYLLTAGVMILALTAVPCLAQRESVQPPAGGDSRFKIVQAVICKDVTDRRPLLAGEAFGSDIGALYCFIRIEGAGPQTRITHNWYYEGTLKASVELPVRGASWRTWSRKAILPEWTGEWMVEILGEDGQPLESIVFHIQ